MFLPGCLALLLALVLAFTTFPGISTDFPSEGQAMMTEFTSAGHDMPMPCEGEKSLPGSHCAAIGGCAACAVNVQAVAEPEPHARAAVHAWNSALRHGNSIAPHPHPPKLTVTA